MDDIDDYFECDFYDFRQRALDRINDRIYLLCEENKLISTIYHLRAYEGTRSYRRCNIRHYYLLLQHVQEQLQQNSEKTRQELTSAAPPDALQFIQDHHGYFEWLELLTETSS